MKRGVHDQGPLQRRTGRGGSRAGAAIEDTSEARAQRKQGKAWGASACNGAGRGEASEMGWAHLRGSGGEVVQAAGSHEGGATGLTQMCV